MSNVQAGRVPAAGWWPASGPVNCWETRQVRLVTTTFDFRAFTEGELGNGRVVPGVEGRRPSSRQLGDGHDLGLIGEIRWKRSRLVASVAAT